MIINHLVWRMRARSRKARHRSSGFNHDEFIAGMDEEQFWRMRLIRSLTRNASKTYDQLGSRFRITLVRYGIRGEEWDIARATVGADGIMHIYPDDTPTTNLGPRSDR